MTDSPSHPNDPLHGITLETVLRAMVDLHGWRELAQQIPIRCFMFDPTIRSSLTFLRKNPWARKKLEDWYVYEMTRKRIQGKPAFEGRDDEAKGEAGDKDGPR
jgi:uncharacterized protein (DUF2132 family)